MRITRRSGPLCARLLPLLLGFAAASRADVPVSFRFDPPGEPREVSVAGDWNGWSPSADPLADPEGDGVFEATLLLSPGRHAYKFVAGGAWFEDPEAAESVSNPYGGRNSVLYAGREEGDAPRTYRIDGRRAPAAPAMREVSFTYHADPPPGRVFLAGTFNDWSTARHPMEGPDSEGVFHRVLLLAPGEYRYKFVADGVWHPDPENERTTDDGFGGRNSVLVVDDRFPEVALRAGDGAILGTDLSLSEGGVSAVRVEPGRIVITARAFQGDITGASILFRRRGGESLTPMNEIGRDGRFTYYRGELLLPVSAEGRLGVVLRDGDTTRVMTRSGLRAEARDSDLLELDPVGTPLFTVPDWLVDGVLYQIFPERFRNGSKRNDPDFSEWYYEGKNVLPAGGKTNGEYDHLVRDWYDIAGLKTSPYRTDGLPDYFSFYGGDLDGVTEKLPYLKDLGVTILYFNPLQTARSNHKYDGCNFREVDPHFGGNEAFRRLVEKAHGAGIRILVDGVFNHTGTCHYAFDDARRNGSASPYWQWYEWKKWPLPETMAEGEKESDYYDCWGGHGALPNLNFDLSRPGPAEQKALRITDAEPNWPVVEEIEAAARFWLEEMDADGFRLDVANEVPVWFWKLFREEVRRVKPDAAVIAELWGNAAEDLSPHRFDGTMNYRFFREPAVAFFALSSIDAAAFDLRLAGGRYGYPLPAARAAMNLLGSHDTERFLTLAGGDIRRYLLAMLFSATYVGVPHIYYGDEIGLEGGRDPDCRRPFPWKRVDEPASRALRERIGAYLAARHAHPALRRGAFRTLLAEGTAYAFARWEGTDRLVVLLNAGTGPAEITIERDLLPFDGGPARDVIAGEEIPWEGGLLTLRLPPLSGTILDMSAPEGAGAD